MHAEPKIQHRSRWRDDVKPAIGHYWQGFTAVMTAVGLIWFLLNFLGPDWEAYRKGGQEVWRFILSDANRVLGLLLHCGLLLLAAGFIIFCVLVIRHLAKKDLSLGVKRALRRLGRVTEDHALIAVKAARKGVANGPSVSNAHRKQWDELLCAALRGLSDPEVYLRHGEKHIDDLPVLFSNFECYARGVKNVLEAIQSLSYAHAERTVIWTLLKRSLIEWYLPFPADVPGDTPAHVTFQWWEDYKFAVEQLKSTSSPVQMRRLVAHRKAQVYSPSGWYVSNAATRLDGVYLDRTATYHPFVKMALDCRSSLPADAYVRLIKDAGAEGYTELVHDFETRYHQKREPNEYDRGVFLKYLKSTAEVSELLSYDDIFVVRLPCKLHFGLAFINDEVHDVSGTRLVPSDSVPQLVEKLSQGWMKGQLDYCTLP